MTGGEEPPLAPEPRTTRLAPSRLSTRFTAQQVPTPAGQGASLIERLFTGISGSQTGGQGVLDISMSELVQTGGSFSNWPLNLPGAGSQTEVTLNVPYRSTQGPRGATAGENRENCWKARTTCSTTAWPERASATVREADSRDNQQPSA